MLVNRKSHSVLLALSLLQKVNTMRKTKIAFGLSTPLFLALLFFLAVPNVNTESLKFKEEQGGWVYGDMDWASLP